MLELTNKKDYSEGLFSKLLYEFVYKQGVDFDNLDSIIDNFKNENHQVGINLSYINRKLKLPNGKERNGLREKTEILFGLLYDLSFDFGNQFIITINVQQEKDFEFLKQKYNLSISSKKFYTTEEKSAINEIGNFRIIKYHNPGNVMSAKKQRFLVGQEQCSKEGRQIVISMDDDLYGFAFNKFRNYSLKIKKPGYFYHKNEDLMLTSSSTNDYVFQYKEFINVIRYHCLFLRLSKKFFNNRLISTIVPAAPSRMTSTSTIYKINDKFVQGQILFIYKDFFDDSIFSKFIGEYDKAYDYVLSNGIKNVNGEDLLEKVLFSYLGIEMAFDYKCSGYLTQQSNEFNSSTIKNDDRINGYKFQAKYILENNLIKNPINNELIYPSFEKNHIENNLINFSAGSLGEKNGVFSINCEISKEFSYVINEFEIVNMRPSSLSFEGTYISIEKSDKDSFKLVKKNKDFEIDTDFEQKNIEEISFNLVPSEEPWKFKCVKLNETGKKLKVVNKTSYDESLKESTKGYGTNYATILSKSYKAIYSEFKRKPYFETVLNGIENGKVDLNKRITSREFEKIIGFKYMSCKKRMTNPKKVLNKLTYLKQKVKEDKYLEYLIDDVHSFHDVLSNWLVDVFIKTDYYGDIPYLLKQNLQIKIRKSFYNKLKEIS